MSDNQRVSGGAEGVAPTPADSSAEKNSEDNSGPHKRDKPVRPEMDAITPRQDTTAPGKSGTVPEDIDVAMPEDYQDPWRK